MDEEMRAYLDQMRGEISQMRREFNDGQERLFNRLAILEQDFQNTKGFLINDSIVAGPRWLDLDKRMSRLERKP